MEKYYKILGLDYNTNISKETIRKAFLKKVKHVHPDYNKSKNAEEEFRNLYEAYEILMNQDNTKDNTKDNFKSTKKEYSNFMFFDKHLKYWLTLIFGENMPSFVKNGYEPTGIFGPPYK